jgi:GntR family transcriptional regulator/MocR family aminotransferase
VQKTWAISGVDLHLDLRGSRVRASLEMALREAVSTGRLAAGTRLPSTRALASDLGLARNTVAEAYSQLVAEGWLTARVGSGTRVAARPGSVSGPAGVSAAPRDDAAGLAAGQPPARFDLMPGSPDVSAFPRAAWLSAARRALAAAPSSALDYGDPRGQPGLRQALAGYLARARGLRTSPERIVICTGFTQAIAVLSQALCARGTRVIALERYGLPGVPAATAAAGLEPMLLDIDGEGADVRALGAAGSVLLTPAHQFPLGVALSAPRRAAVVAWAQSTGGWVIEDDYDGEFRYDRHPLGAVQGLAPEHVVYAGTASKTLAPGLRLAWLALPEALIEDVAAAKALADRQSSALDQLTLAELIRSGAYDRHIRHSRLAYRRRRDRVVLRLGDIPGVRVSGIAAGLHALVELPPGSSEHDVVAAAAARGLALEGLEAYAAASHDRGPALVLGYAKPPEHAFTGALARLIAVLKPG